MTIPHLHPLWSERLRTTTGCGVFFHACIADIRSGSGDQSAPTLNAVRKLARAQYPWAILFLTNSLVQLPNFLAAWVNGYREIGFLAEVPITLQASDGHDNDTLSCSVLPSTIQFDLLVFPWRVFFSSRPAVSTFVPSKELDVRFRILLFALLLWHNAPEEYHSNFPTHHLPGFP